MFRRDGLPFCTAASRSLTRQIVLYNVFLAGLRPRAKGAQYIAVSDRGGYKILRFVNRVVRAFCIQG